MMIADSRQQTADSRQQTADKQTADSRQETCSRQQTAEQTADSRQQTRYKAGYHGCVLMYHTVDIPTRCDSISPISG
jgi:hypothetical protein